ncbi:extracellular solute-binding protein [Acuticoccus kandeliae]|uniref:extracellular solute-binding protein n=1 Tax=Acuticoccus kandeliae TaxID=2073160 RepID=UPI000D3EAA18|nr:extracellular solute-binding protein [Acuticoccus kandeliae]
MNAARTTRRAFLSYGAAAAALGAAPLSLAGPARAVAPATGHGISLIGPLRYDTGFAAFDYVDADAPKGGVLRQTRIGAFDTVNTLRFPGRPPAELRMIYDHLIVASEDEIASYYGVLAETVEVAPDFSEIVFTMRPEARWHDGAPVTSEDVAFTFETLKAEGAPYYRQAFATLTTRTDGDRVVFQNARRGDRDVIRRISTIPVHPLHVWRDGTPETPVGSGPYRVASFAAPRRLELERVAEYWGGAIGPNRGRWNFDRLVFDYYRDATVAFEAFKAGEADVRLEDDPNRWQSGYDGSALTDGTIQRDEARMLSVGALHGFVYNLRRPLLADPRVRRALALAYDFEQVNSLLFKGAYAPFDSVFAETPLAATGPAASAERAIFADAGAEITDAALADPDPFADGPRPGSREALAAASALLDEAGFAIVDGTRINPATGAPLTFDVLTPTPGYERPLAWLARALSRLGVTLAPVQTDTASAMRRMLDRDYDLASLSWSPARLPGTAERLLWHSALADRPGSYAISGLKSPALDAAIEALEQAQDDAALATAGRAFDRAFRHAEAMLPLWRSDRVWVAWWDAFNRPHAETEGFPPSPTDRWSVAAR